MDLRIALASLVLASAPALAQEKSPDVPDAPRAAAQEPQQQPEEAKLAAEKERLLKEIAYAQERAAKAKQFLAERLGKRGQEFGSIDAGSNRPAAVQPSPITKARVMSAEELKAADEDVMLTVDGLPIRAGEFQELVDYLAGQQHTGTDEARDVRAMNELIRVRSVQASYPDNGVDALAREVYQQLQQGRLIGEFIEAHGPVAGTDASGKLQVARNSFLGVAVEKAVFALKAGEFTRPIRNAYGFAIFQADDIVHGEETMQDRVIGRGVQLKYVGDQEQAQFAQTRAARGQVEIVVRDEATLRKLPYVYRPASAMPAPRQPRTEPLKARLQEVEAKLAELRRQPEDVGDAKAQIERLEAMRAQLLRTIENQKEDSDRPAPSDDMPAGKVEGAPARPVPAGPGPKKAPAQPKKQ